MRPRALAARWYAGARIALPALSILTVRHLRDTVTRRATPRRRGERPVGKIIELRPPERSDAMAWRSRSGGTDFDRPFSSAAVQPRTRTAWVRRYLRLRAHARRADFDVFTVESAGEPVGELVARFDTGTATADLWLWLTVGEDVDVIGDVLAVATGHLASAYPGIRRIVLATLPASAALRDILASNGFECEGRAPRRVVDESSVGSREQWTVLVAPPDSETARRSTRKRPST